MSLLHPCGPITQALYPKTLRAEDNAVDAVLSREASQKRVWQRALPKATAKTIFLQS